MKELEQKLQKSEEMAKVKIKILTDQIFKLQDDNKAMKQEIS